jgi:hypothetical protein
VDGKGYEVVNPARRDLTLYQQRFGFLCRNEVLYMRMLFRNLVILSSIAFVNVVNGQGLKIAELTSMVGMEHFAIDTLMKKKGYRLMQKESDSVSQQFYYSHLERNDAGPTWVRALSYVDVNLEDVKSRVLTYRTYNREEYQALMADMLSKGYRTKNVFDFKDSKHTVFEDGIQPIRVKVGNNKMADGRRIRSYEFELGK